MTKQDEKVADTLYEIMGKLAESGDAVINAFDKLVYLEKSGVLDQLVRLSELMLSFSKLPDELLDSETVEVAMKNIELLLTLALSVDERTIKTVENLIKAFKETEEFEAVGIAGSLKALRDEDVQKALGFLIAFAKNFGRKL